MKTSTVQQFKNITIFINTTPANEDALVELGGLIPELRPLVEKEIDMDVALNRPMHQLARISDSVNFLRNHLYMLSPVTLPTDAPDSLVGKMQLVRNDGTGDLLLTIPVSGDDRDRDYMLFSVLPIVVNALFDDGMSTPTFYESWPRQ